MGLFGLIITLVAGAVGGWFLKGKVDKKSDYRPSRSTDDEDL